MFNKLIVLGAFLSFTIVPAYAEQVSLSTPLDGMQKVNMLEQAINKYTLAPMGNMPGSMETYENSTKRVRENLQTFVKILKKQIVKNNNTEEIIFDEALLEKVLEKGKTSFDKKQKYVTCFFALFGSITLLAAIPLALELKTNDHRLPTATAIQIGAVTGSLIGGLTSVVVLLVGYSVSQRYIRDFMFIFKELYIENLIDPYVKTI